LDRRPSCGKRAWKIGRLARVAGDWANVAPK
jgi:hypothetical protein